MTSIRVPLSLMQEHMWWLERYAPAEGFFNESLRHRLRPEVEAASVRAALGLLVRRHESLRTTFPLSDGEPYQSIAAPTDVALAITDLSALSPVERQAELGRIHDAEVARPFDTAAGPLLRAHLVVAGEVKELVMVFDHLICDPTSAAILTGELDEICDALVSGRIPDLAPAQLDFADFAVWQRRFLDAEALEEYEEHWARTLHGLRPSYRIPLHPSACGSPTTAAVTPPGMMTFSLDGEVSGRLRTMFRTSSFVLTAAAVAALVARATGEPDTLMVTSVDGRDRAELASMVGLFGGVSLLRVDLAGDPPFETIVRRARHAVLGLLEHQHLPVWQVLEAARRRQIDVSLRAIPVALHFYHASRHRWVPGTSVVAAPPAVEGPSDPGTTAAAKPLEFRIYDDGAAWWGELLHHPQWYDESHALRIVSGLKALLAAVAEDPLLPLSALPLEAA